MFGYAPIQLIKQLIANIDSGKANLFTIVHHNILHWGRALAVIVACRASLAGGSRGS